VVWKRARTSSIFERGLVAKETSKVKRIGGLEA
jgi:hypothetical protein